MNNINTRFTNVSFAELEQLVDNIHQQVIASGWRPDYIVGITRGGLIPAVMLSHKLDCAMHALGVSLRDGGSTETNAWMAEDAFGYKGTGYSVEQKQILIVDDINDSGATLNWIQQDWQSSCLPSNERWKSVWGNTVRVAVVFDKQPSTCLMPISYQGEIIPPENTSDWVVFPYERSPNDHQ